MKKRALQLTLCLLIAAAATGVAYWQDSEHARRTQSEIGLRWARQVASQAESMAYRGQELREKDPLQWASNLLTQGTEPRVVRVARFRAETNSLAESWELDEKSGTFELSKVIFPESSAGVRVWIELGKTGFLGMPSRLAGDLLAALCFTLVFMAAFLPTSRWTGIPDQKQLQLRVRRWIQGAKTQLISLSSHVRELVRSAQRLAVSSHKSHQHVADLRDRIHSELTDLREEARRAQTHQELAARASTIALNAVIEANRLGAPGHRIAVMVQELHKSIQRLGESEGHHRERFEALERRIEPWATDADLAFHCFDEVKDSSRKMREHIQGTTGSITRQVAQLSELTEHVGENAVRIPPPPPPSSPASKHELPAPLPPLRDSA